MKNRKKKSYKKRKKKKKKINEIVLKQEIMVKQIHSYIVCIHMYMYTQTAEHVGVVACLVVLVANTGCCKLFYSQGRVFL